jgi:hypothetical protein
VSAFSDIQEDRKMAILGHPSLPAMPSDYKAKVEDEGRTKSFKGKGLSVTVTYESSGTKKEKCNKINLGKGKDIFIVWKGEDLHVYGWSTAHGPTNKDYVGYFLSKNSKSFKIA